jgi:site-specific DNA-adenine methylase
MEELSIFPEQVLDAKVAENTTTFQDNMKLPIHRWYRYTAGFSGAWVGQVIEEEKKNGRRHVIDPFAGSGTVMVEAMLHGVDSFGIESNPYVYRIAQAKLMWKDWDDNDLLTKLLDVLQKAKTIEVKRTEYPSLILRCFTEENLNHLEALREACLEVEDKELKLLVWFIITSILRSTSYVGTAQWQYIQPKKSKAKVLEPFDAYQEKVIQIINDIRATKSSFGKDSISNILKEDARDIKGIPDKWGDLVITSPPYANNYDYADAMRLEMLFWDDIQGWDDLQEKVSVHLIRACTQHVSALKNVEEEYLDSENLTVIRDEIKEKYALLEKERLSHGGKKNYHKMIAAYFYDMAKVFISLNRVTTDNCKMCFVIGDSAPYGIYIPVDEWLGKLAISAGFKSYSFEKLRDRNVKWKNRKHRVPLKEGRLWISK